MQRLIVSSALVALALACSDSGGPPTPVPSSDLHFVVQDTTAPPLYTTADSFYAKAGDGRELRMYYRDTVSGRPGEEFLRFEVPGGGLRRKPDGSAFQTGDSILISVRVVDARQFVFDFQPAGLEFDSHHPARLKLEYLHSNHDFDRDGRITPADSTIKSRLDLWRNEPPSTLWYNLGAVNFESLEELDVNILSFSQYAVAG
jgi:hypothetical protein